MNTLAENKDSSIEFTSISRSPSDGIALGDGDCISPTKIKEKIFEDIMNIDWNSVALTYKENECSDLKEEQLANRLQEISAYIISIFDEKKCTKSWKEYISYLNGFVAAVVFANITTNQNDLFLKNGITASGIMIYNAINFYVASLASVKKHFEERYRHLDQLIDDAYITKSIYEQSDIESQNIENADSIMDIIKAIVLTMYSLEKEMNTKVERLNQRVFANYCLDLVQAAFLYVTNKASLSNGISNNLSDESRFIGLSVALFNQIEIKNFKRYFWETITQEDGKHSEIMLNTIARHYNGKSKYTHSSKDLFYYSYRLEDFENHSSDIVSYLSKEKEACNNSFKLFVNVIENKKQIERNLFLLGAVIIISSIAYSMSFNNPFGVSQLSYNIFYSAFAFIAAQKIEQINAEKSEKYESFIRSIRDVSHSLKTGRFLENSERKRSTSSFKPKWLYSIDRSNDPTSIKASPILRDIHYITALTFVKLGDKTLYQSSINKMDMATCYMNINIALAKTYEQIAKQDFKFSEIHASAISSALAILILENIRGSQNGNFDPAAIFRPITGVLLNVPSVSDIYQTIDKTIDVHELQRQQNVSIPDIQQTNPYVSFAIEKFKETRKNNESKFSPSKIKMKRTTTPTSSANTELTVSPYDLKINIPDHGSWSSKVLERTTPSPQELSL